MTRFFLLHSTLAAFVSAASSSLESRQASGHNVKSGLYSVQGCGSNASEIVAVLESMQEFLQPSLIDVRSIHTSDAYNAFFKDVNNAPFIANILDNIASGNAIVPGLAQPGFRRKTSPVIACIPDPPIARPDPELVGLTLWVQAFARKDCKNRGENAYAVFIGGTNIVVLCPPWFAPNNQFMQPKLKRPCIAVDRVANEFKGLGYPLAQNKRSWMLHELVHVYVVAATNLKVPYSEVYTVNNCFRLASGYQRYMPNNYVYYASNIFYNCTAFPIVRSFHDRELSELSPNVTDDVIWANMTLGVTELP